MVLALAVRICARTEQNKRRSVPRTLVLLVLKPLQPHAADRAWRINEIDLVVQVEPDGEQDRPNRDDLRRKIHTRTTRTKRVGRLEQEPL